MAHRAHTPKVVLYARSCLFQVAFVLSTIIYATLGLLTFMLPFERRYGFLTSWGHLNVWLCARICKLDYRVEGLKNIPDCPSVILASHQSTWETLAFNQFFPPLAWVVKRELIWIPFFGWGLAMIQPIVINRGAGQRASQQLLEQGSARLKDGRWILIFPQGTRVLPGQQRRYKLGGVLLARENGVPVIPVAHNAGDFWPRRQFVKYPGTITVSIGPAIDSRGKSSGAINAEVKGWIDRTETVIRASNGKPV
jgi:1-acyl-sn-glycerol-3-phosphate acyltransferase